MSSRTTVLLALLVGCSEAAAPAAPGDAGVSDSGFVDATSAPDAAAPDAEPAIPDAAAEPIDAGSPDATVVIPPDPTEFRAAGRLRVARSLPTATRLADGRVLIVGGEDGAYRMLDSVEIYDPSNDSVVDAAPLPEARVHHSAVLLEDGRVLVIGGGQGSEISIATGEGTLMSASLYDPASDSWTSAGNMSVPRAGHRSALLDDGRVLVVGGGSVAGYPCASKHPNCTVADSIGTAEIFDPQAETWSMTAPMAQPRIAFALNSTGWGVIASAGAARNQGLTSVEVFDPQTETWRAAPSLTGQRLYHSAVVLSDRLVVAGGKISNVAPVTSVDVLSAGEVRWAARAALDVPRTGAAFVALASGRGLLVGGSNQVGNRFLNLAAIYDADLDAWTPIGALRNGRYSHATVVLDDGSVLVVGGRGSLGALATIERTQ